MKRKGCGPCTEARSFTDKCGLAVRPGQARRVKQTSKSIPSVVLEGLLGTGAIGLGKDKYFLGLVSAVSEPGVTWFQEEVI
jgi:hypothetical protein